MPFATLTDSMNLSALLRTFAASLVLLSACSSDEPQKEETPSKEAPVEDSGKTDVKPAEVKIDSGTPKTKDAAVARDAKNSGEVTAEKTETSPNTDSDTPTASGVTISRESTLRVLPKKWSDKKLKKYMVGISKGLGVKCAYCHVKGDNASDKIKRKQEARQMIAMTRKLDRRYMGGKGLITCQTCHKGKSKP